MADTPIACSLGAGELAQRLTEIAEIGKESLISRGTEGDRHLLRFRASTTARRRLEAVIAAEGECCSFLDLSLCEERGELIIRSAHQRMLRRLRTSWPERLPDDGMT